MNVANIGGDYEIGRSVRCCRDPIIFEAPYLHKGAR